jgi:hypothetical protein
MMAKAFSADMITPAANQINSHDLGSMLNDFAQLKALFH